VGETHDVEIVAALFKPAPADKAPEQIQTLWIEPLSSKLFEELPYEKPGPNKPHLRPLTAAIPQRPDEVASAARAQSIEELNIQIRELRRALREKEVQVDELRAGGLGKQAAPPDADGLLDAFIEHFYSARLRVQGIQSKIAETSAASSNPRKVVELAELDRQLKSVVARQDAWVRKLADLIKLYAEDRKKLKQTG
jgi:hypothetical protein